MLVIFCTSSDDEDGPWRGTESGAPRNRRWIMLEFLMTMAVVALIFCAATVFVALMAGGLMKARQAMQKKEGEAEAKAAR